MPKVKKTISKEYLITNGITLLFFELLFWICNVFPRHLLEINGWYTILATLINGVYYVLYFLFIVVVFQKNGTLFSDSLFHSFEPLYKRLRFKRIGLLLLVQLGFDAVNLLLHTLPDGYRYVLSTCVTVLNWLVVYWVATAKEYNIFSKKRTLIIATAVLGGMLVAACMADGRSIGEIGYLSEKYVPTSVVLQASLQNLEFTHIFINFLLDAGVGLLLLVLHTLQPGFKPVLRFKPDDEDLPKSHSTARVVGQSLILLVAFSLMVVFKLMIYPCLSYQFTGGSSHSEVSYENPKDFVLNTDSVQQIRMGNDWQKTAWNQEIINTIQFDGADIDSFYTVVDTKPSQELSGNTIVINSFYNEYAIDGTNVKVFKDHAICFVENEKPVVIMVDDIDDCEKNDILIQTCEALLSNGHISLFEYGCDYLLRCDSQIIQSFIDRYAAGDFNAKELSYMETEGLSKDNIIAIAKTHK